MGAAELSESRREEIAALCRRFAVRRLRLFGSALTDRWNENTSDLDFLVEYSPEIHKLPPLDRLVGLQLALEELFCRDVDFVDWAVARNPFFRENAESHTRELYAA